MVHQFIQYFLDLKIGTKLVVGFAVVGMLLVVGTGAGVLSTFIYKNLFDTMFKIHIIASQDIADIIDAGIRIQKELDQYLLTQENLPRLTDVFEKEMAVVDQGLSKGAEIELDVKGQSHLQTFKDAWKEYKTNLNAAAAQFQSGKLDAADLIQLQQTLAESQAFFYSTASNWRTYNFEGASRDYTLSQSQYSSLVIFLVTAGFMGVVISQVMGWLVTRTIVQPLDVIRLHLRRLSVGESDTDKDSRQDRLKARKDEMGDLARDLGMVNNYIRSVSELTDRVSEGDLSVKIHQRGERDQLSQGLARMLAQLNDLVTQMSLNSTQVGNASQQLTQAANQTSLASGQITTTIQQVAQGINRQSDDMKQAVTVLDSTSRAIGRVAKGVGEQERAVVETVRATGQMDEAIQQMISNVKAVSTSASMSAERAGDGAKTLRQTVESMDVIRSQVEILNERVSAVSQRSEEIGSVIDVIEEIATKTNILAINATIEAARAEVQAKKLTEEVVGRMMITQCQMVNQMLLHGFAQKEAAFWKEFCVSTLLDLILVTDEDGCTIISNDPKMMNWRFPEDPKEQAYPFRQLINQKDGVLTQESKSRSIDGLAFKFTGVSRADQPGIVQVGFNMDTLKKHDLRIGGFAVVAGEVYQLAERARGSAREIRSLVKGIQLTVDEAVNAMRKSQHEVDLGMERADSAGNALKQILEGVKDVSVQVGLALKAVEQMQNIARAVAGEVKTFSRIVDENNAAVNEMKTGYNHLEKTIARIASLSAENSVAAQEVSVSSEQMREQMEEVDMASITLEEMAGQLRSVVMNFRLNGSGA
jgi:methyl-accepting chemotaxis protein